jgi:hypothetical protein
VVAVVAHLQVVHHEHRLSRLRGVLLHREDHVASDHQRGKLRLRRRFGKRLARDSALPEHHNTVGNSEHFLQLVRDEDDRLAAFREPPHDGEQVL